MGVEGQARLKKSHALIVGAGGLGSPAALYLAASGVGILSIADDDVVEIHNLQRQILHTDMRLGRNKAESARETLAAINPEVQTRAISRRLTEDDLETLLDDADVALDCSDNFPTRDALNRACLRRKKPLVSGAASGFSGQLAVFDFRQKNAPCYHCLFPNGEEAEETRCALTGIFAPLTGLIGTLQAAETLKLLTGIASYPNDAGFLLRVQLRAQDWRIHYFSRDPGCVTCAASA
jgi:adenylyltransferase/sulfurtransferase